MLSLIDRAGVNPDAYSEPYQAPKIELFAKIATGFNR